MHLTATVAEEEEQTVGEDEQEGDNEGVKVLVGNHDVADVDDKLQHSITC